MPSSEQLAQRFYETMSRISSSREMSDPLNEDKWEDVPLEIREVLEDTFYTLVSQDVIKSVDGKDAVTFSSWWVPILEQVAQVLLDQLREFNFTELAAAQFITEFRARAAKKMKSSDLED